MSGHGDPTRFRWVFELPMTSPGGNEKPAVISEKLEDITNFHGVGMIGDSTERSHITIGES